MKQIFEVSNLKSGGDANSLIKALTSLEGIDSVNVEVSINRNAKVSVTGLCN